MTSAPLLRPCLVQDGRGPRRHVPAPAKFNDAPRWSCVMCGRWLIVEDLILAEPVRLSSYEDADAYDAGSEPYKP